MSSQVFLNGRFVERQDARVSAFDAGFQHGIGLFETLMARHGRVFRGHRHVQRLVDSAKILGLSDTLRPGPLLEAIDLTVARSGRESARVRLTVTGGELNLLQGDGAAPRDPTILIVAQPPSVYPEEVFENGVLVTVTVGLANPLDPTAGHKTLNYWSRLRALQKAGLAGASESLCFSTANRLAGGCVSNVFLARQGTLLTPPCRGEETDDAGRQPVLPGVTRAAIMELASVEGIGVATRELTVDDLLAAEECFLTNSSWGVLPVRQVEAHRVGDGTVGPLARLLRQRWLDLVEQETLAEAGEAPSN